MKTIELIQIILFFGLGIALTAPMGRFMAKVFKGEKTFLHPILQSIEKLREKLESNPAQPELLITEPGVGYRLLLRE